MQLDSALAVFPSHVVPLSNDCMNNPPAIDKKRLSQLLDHFLKLSAAGAGKADHQDHEERERFLDEMQQMLGLGMVMERDIVAKAKKALGRT